MLVTSGCSLSLGLDDLDSSPTGDGGGMSLAGQSSTGGTSSGVGGTGSTTGTGGKGGTPAGAGGAGGIVGAGNGGAPSTAGFPTTSGSSGASGSTSSTGGKGGGGAGGTTAGKGGSGTAGTGGGSGGTTSGNGGNGGNGTGGAGTGGSGGTGTSGTGGSAGAPTGAIDLATDQKTPLGIGLDDLHVYWVNTKPPAIYRVLKTGGTPEALVTAIDLSDPRDVIVDGNTLYWSDWTGNVIRKRDVSGGTPQDFATGAGRVGALAINSGIIYATDDRTDQLGQGTVIVVPAGTNGAQVLFSAEPLATGMAVAGNDLAWGRNGSIALGTTSGGPSVTLVGMADTVKITGVALDNTDVYWVEDEQRIRKANRANGTPVIFYDPPGALGAGDVASDATFVYWTEPDSGHIRKQAK